MKFCVNCGAQVEDDKGFCFKCGAPVDNQQYYNNQPNQGYGYPQPQPISVVGWIGRSHIPFIPIVGTIVYIIMLFIWCGDKTKELTFRNWAKVQLIVWLVVLILAILILVILAMIIPRWVFYFYFW